MTLDDVVDLLYENILCTKSPEDSNTNGKKNEEISEASTCDGQGEEWATEGQHHNISQRYWY